MKKRWMLITGKIADIEAVKQNWQWHPLPPLDVVVEFLKGYNCIQCRTLTGPFLFIGKYRMSRPNQWVGFRRPPWLLHDGNTFAHLKEMPCTEDTELLQ